MKISLRWIFDHLEADMHSIDINVLVDTFNKITAEIEGYEKIELALEHLFQARIVTINEDKIIILCQELGQELELPFRSDLVVGDSALIMRDKAIYRWATSADVGGTKSESLPALCFDQQDVAASGFSDKENRSCQNSNTAHGNRGSWNIGNGNSKNLSSGDWKKAVESVDYVLHVDNKSLTHRPDMWSHRGFAREIGAFFDISLKPLSFFLTDIPVMLGDMQGVVGGARTIDIQDNGCDRFSCLSLTNIEQKSSLLAIALRLARIDSKPINALVDFTNYVMFDIGLPMHAFDADRFISDQIVIRRAYNTETLVLLGGQKIELNQHDLVVCDGKIPVSLAGIKGGSETAVQKDTKSLLLEAGHWDATTIRLSSARHKNRTEASIRFEKSIDGSTNIDALKRFVYLCDRARISYTISGKILSLGVVPAASIVVVEHAFIEQRLGVSVDPSFVQKTLEQLEFCVDTENREKQVNKEESVNREKLVSREELARKEKIGDTVNGDYKKQSKLVYIIGIPPFRATKDISCREDIVEEIGRFYGYGSIPEQFPSFLLTPKDNRSLMRMRMIKRLLVDGAAMRELYTYSFFDEAFLKRLHWQPAEDLEVQHPVSENWKRLVTSLIPNMLNAVEHESNEYDKLRFFELARVWRFHNQIIEEKEVLSGIIFDKHHEIDFYDVKSIITKIIDFVGMGVSSNKGSEISWESVKSPTEMWFAPYKTAHVMHKGVCVARVGMVPSEVLHRIADGYAYVFECDAELLRSYRSTDLRYVPTPKYPAIERDISMLIPLPITVAQVIHLVKKIVEKADDRVGSVTLIDFFEKKEWPDKKSITIRLKVQDQHKTMKKEEIDELVGIIIAELGAYGAEIR